jgi:hypothetical protein
MAFSPLPSSLEEALKEIKMWRENHRQQRTWVGLTHEEIDYQAKKDDHGFYFALGALWAEVKLKEKNT